MWKVLDSGQAGVAAVQGGQVSHLSSWSSEGDGIGPTSRPRRQELAGRPAWWG